MFDDDQNQGGPRMKEDAADKETRERVESGAANEIRAFVERFERLEAEKKEIADQQKEVMAEAKGRGFCTKSLRRVIAERKKDPDQRAEDDAVFEMYAAAVGL